MIENGVVTYRGIGGDILTWRFSSDVVNELAIAVLLTILSYQVAETVINLFFGWKRQGQATLKDIQIMLLIRQFSPMSVVRTIRSWSRKKDQGREENEEDEELGESMTEEREVSGTAYLKLMTLLVAIPLINVGTVVLSFERNTTLTFADGNFGGLAFGVDKDRSISDWAPLSRSPKSRCNGTTLQTSAAEFAIAQFFSCILDVSSPNSVPSPRKNNTFRVAVKAGTTERAAISVDVATRRVELVKRTMILSRNGTVSPSEQNVTISNENITFSEEQRFLFYVESKISEEDANFLLRRGMELAKDHCASPLGKPQEAREEDQTGFIVGQIVDCERDPQRNKEDDMESARAVADELLSFLSFVNSDTLNVTNASPENNTGAIQEFFSGQSLLLLKRQRGFASVPILAIAAFGSMFLRILSEIITKNDLERGIGLIVRDGLGLPCCDSMLCSPDVVVRYNRRGSVLRSIERQPLGSRGGLESVLPS